MELPQEYWRQRTLFEIASEVDTPLALDDATLNRTFGHYARVLVDIDLSKHLFEEILVEREGYAFKLGIVYE
ncbi:defensin-like protein, partial [Trifolium medium]|nr:defensin-like protein [Trifolium medium]